MRTTSNQCKYRNQKCHSAKIKRKASKRKAKKAKDSIDKQAASVYHLREDIKLLLIGDRMKERERFHHSIVKLFCS